MASIPAPKTCYSVRADLIRDYPEQRWMHAEQVESARVGNFVKFYIGHAATREVIGAVWAMVLYVNKDRAGNLINLSAAPTGVLPDLPGEATWPGQVVLELKYIAELSLAAPVRTTRCEDADD
jgi:hypothetical protein